LKKRNSPKFKAFSKKKSKKQEINDFMHQKSGTVPLKSVQMDSLVMEGFCILRKQKGFEYQRIKE
jgi:hypothetical protein